MEKLQVNLIQFDIVWEQPEVNRKILDKLLRNKNNENSILLLPEMFTTGFSGNSRALAENMTGNNIDWMKEHSKALNSVLAGTIIIAEDGKYFNRFLWVQPDGKIQSYDKRHLFRMSDEPNHFDPGNHLTDIEYQGWKFRLMVCYDLRFPVWSRNTSDYNVLIYSANWPASRSEVWLSLLKARAIENFCYVAGINRCGTDGKAINYNGFSSLFNFKGELIAQAGASEEILSTSLNYEELMNFRKKFPAHLDRDEFEVR